MADSGFVPSAEAAAALGVSQQEVRRGVPRRMRGRCLRLVTGDDVDVIDRVVRSKLRAALKQVTAERLGEVTARRAVVHHYRVRDQYLARLLGEDGVVRTGLSAVENDPEFDLVSLDAAVVDVYCEELTHQRLRSEYGLVPGDALSKVTLRVVDDLDRVGPGAGGHRVRDDLAVRGATSTQPKTGGIGVRVASSQQQPAAALTDVSRKDGGHEPAPKRIDAGQAHFEGPP